MRQADELYKPQPKYDHTLICMWIKYICMYVPCPSASELLFPALALTSASCGRDIKFPSSSRSKSLPLQLQFPGDCSGTRLLNHQSEHRGKGPCSQQSLSSFTEEVLLSLTYLGQLYFLCNFTILGKKILSQQMFMDLC